MAKTNVASPDLAPGSEFIVKLNGIKLPVAAEKRIAAELQKTLLAELARVDLKGGAKVFVPRIDWLGIWIDRFLRPGIPPQLKVTAGRQ